jgi:glutathionyl-hydroquinone reductase
VRLSFYDGLDLTSPNAADGVYKAGFASTQSAYENAVYPLFKSLDRLEEMLKGKDYLVGNTLTEADIRFFVTTVRAILEYIAFPLKSLALHRSALIPCMWATSNAICVTSATGTPTSICEFVIHVNKMMALTSESVSWMRKLYWKNDAFKSSTKFDHIKEAYYWSLTTVRYALRYIAFPYSFTTDKPLEGSSRWPTS